MIPYTSIYKFWIFLELLITLCMYAYFLQNLSHCTVKSWSEFQTWGNLAIFIVTVVVFIWSVSSRTLLGPAPVWAGCSPPLASQLSPRTVPLQPPGTCFPFWSLFSGPHAASLFLMSFTHVSEENVFSDFLRSAFTTCLFEKHHVCFFTCDFGIRYRILTSKDFSLRTSS